jgi:hypothetical protein
VIDWPLVEIALVAILAASIVQLRRWHVTMAEEKKDKVLVVVLIVVGVILMLALLALAVGPLMMR